MLPEAYGSGSRNYEQTRLIPTKSRPLMLQGRFASLPTVAQAG